MPLPKRCIVTAQPSTGTAALRVVPQCCPVLRAVPQCCPVQACREAEECKGARASSERHERERHEAEMALQEIRMCMAKESPEDRMEELHAKMKAWEKDFHEKMADVQNAKVLALCLLQRADGAFALDDKLAACIGAALGDLTALAKVPGLPSRWTSLSLF